MVPVTRRPTVASLLHVVPRHLIAWLAIIGTSGCSLALDGPKPNRPRNYAPKCDDSKGLVVADGLLATALGIGSLSAFGSEEVEAGVVLGLIAVAFTASAVRGNGVVNECRGEQALFAQESAPTFDPSNEQPTGPYVAQPRPPVVPRAPVAAVNHPLAPTDPYVDPRVEPPPQVSAPPARPPTPAPAAIQPTTKPATKPAPAPAEIDPDAWRDFWTEVP